MTVVSHVIENPTFRDISHMNELGFNCDLTQSRSRLIYDLLVTFQGQGQRPIVSREAVCYILPYIGWRPYWSYDLNNVVKLVASKYVCSI